MRYAIVFAPEVLEDAQALKTYLWSQVRDAIEEHFRHTPTQTSASRIKRLRGVSRPKFRLRVGDLRVFYDVTGGTVEVLAVVLKGEVAGWMKRMEGSQ